METQQDPLHQGEGMKKGKEDTPEKDSVVEESLLSESEKEDDDQQIVVSTDEESGGAEPDFSKSEGENIVARESENDSGNLEEDALIAEGSRESDTAVVSAADVMTDEELESEDEHHEHVASDEDEDEEHHTLEHKIPDYGEYEPEKLVKEAELLIKNEPIDKIKDHIDAIRKSLLNQLSEQRQQKLNQFLESGGNEIDFQYTHPLRERFRSLYTDYRQKRQQHYQNLQEKLNNNLRIKLDLIDKIKEIVTKDESIGDTFKEFNAIQQEWKNTGPVPRNESADLWRTYHHHVENFYEYIKINKELRDLDFKKNREAKEKLIAEAEALVEQEHVISAFKALQELHKKWKNIGPVERENREPMWERFSEATRKIHEKRDNFFSDLREKADELIEEKKKLIATLKERDYSRINTHHQWQEAIKEVEKTRNEFRKIGRLNHPENDKIWDEFRGLLREFNHTKNQFYKQLKKQHHDNLEQKRELVAIAEELKDSEDWRETTNEMKRIQAKWKTIGHVPKSESDKIWKQFREACNHFFKRLTEHNKDRDKAFEGNYKKKAQMLEELKAYETDDKSQEDNIVHLKEVIAQWKEIGRVPRNKSKVESEFNSTLDQKFKAIDLDRKESQRIRFENKMETISEEGGERELRRERDTVTRNLQEANKELAQLENNLSFFTSSNPNNPFIKEAEKNISRHREQISILKEKKQMLNVKIRELQREDEQEESDAGNSEADEQSSTA